MKLNTALFALLSCSTEVYYPVPEQAADLGERTAEIDESERIKCRHILIQYKGASNTDPMLERSRDEAYQIAYGLYKELKAGADFASLARQHSDGPSRSYGGELKPNHKGSFDIWFEEAAFGLDIHEISVPVESTYGWHIIQRQDNIEGQFVHILVSHIGALESQSDRSIVEAKERAERAQKAILSGQDPQSVAVEYSDGPAGSRGGLLGWLSAKDLHPQLEAAAFQIKSGELSDPVQTPYGYHIFVRYQ